MRQSDRSRVALYCRVSTGDQSCERQVNELAAFAERAGFEVVSSFKEVASGARARLPEREKVMALARDRRIDAVLVTELSRWGRSTGDLVQTLEALSAWNVSLIAQAGLELDLATPHGKLVASMLAALAEFERELLRERVRSGIALAKAKGQTFGRRRGDRPKARRFGPKVLRLASLGRSYRQIARELHLSTNTVMGIVRREREALREPEDGRARVAAWLPEGIPSDPSPNPTEDQQQGLSDPEPGA